jgi:CRISPR/Cas system-associated exonuclease Cas4 (RecB family)
VKSILGIHDAADFDLKDAFDLDTAYSEYVKQIPSDDRQGVFHPSAVGMCKRKNFYEYTRAPAKKELKVISEERFRLGHAIHAIVGERMEGICEMLRKQGLHASWDAEVPYDKETDQLYQLYGIGGTTDGIFVVGDGTWRQRAIIEIKSIKSELFKKLNGKPKYPHAMQAHIYAERFDAGLIYFFYYSKDTSDRDVIPMKYDPVIATEALEYFVEVGGFVERDEIPDREEDWFFCTECEYGDICQPSILERRTKVRKQARLRRKGFQR